MIKYFAKADIDGCHKTKLFLVQASTIIHLYLRTKKYLWQK